MVIRSGFFRGINPYSSLISAGVVIAFVCATLAFPTQSAQLIDEARTFVTFYAGWWYVTLAGVLLVFLIWIAASKYGTLRLGDPDDRPKYSYFTWFAMLYAAGQGIGIIFWSIAEPVFHYADGSPFSGEQGSPAAANKALEIAFFHWGLKRGRSTASRRSRSRSSPTGSRSCWGSGIPSTRYSATGSRAGSAR